MSAVFVAMLALVATAICSAESKNIQLPADIPVLDGHRVDTVCGSCCQGGSFCGVVPQDIRISSRLLISKGSNMTCMLRSRSTYGAVDGGLCVPSHVPHDFPLPELCRVLDKSSPPSHTLTKTVYQANLVSQEMCGVCCDGFHMCAEDNVCRRTVSSSSPHAICAHKNTTRDSACGHQIDLTDELRCESCDRPTPAAELFEHLHSLPFRRRLQSFGSLLSHTSRKLLQSSTAAPSTTPAQTPATASQASVSLSLPVQTAASTPTATKSTAATVPPSPTTSASAPSSSIPTPKQVPAPSASTAKPGPAPANPTPPTLSAAATTKAASAPSPTQAVKQAPTPTPTSTPRRTPYAFAPSGGGHSSGWCNKSLDCAFPLYNMCKSGKCVKRPGYCESDKHCKAGYECKLHFCAKKQPPTATPKATPKPTSKPMQKQ